jgi:small redox-active disulfide protein 2
MPPTAREENVMKIEVLGTGCPKCNKLEDAARSAAQGIGVPYEIQHVRDITEIVKQGGMATPALAIDGKIVVAGRVPSEAELMTLMRSTMA